MSVTVSVEVTKRELLAEYPTTPASNVRMATIRIEIAFVNPLQAIMILDHERNENLKRLSRRRYENALIEVTGEFGRRVTREFLRRQNFRFGRTDEAKDLKS